MIAGLTWLRAAKIAFPILAAVALVSLGWWTWSVFERTRIERDVAVADVLEMRRAVTDATVPPVPGGVRPLLSVAETKAALAAVVRDRDDARVSLSRIDRETKAARSRADQSDKTLERTQRANLARAAVAEARINELERARPSAAPSENAAAIDTDSKAAWESWR